MPKWGLTANQQELEPWGLSSELLCPAKTLTDPVHGDIYLNRLEVLFLDSPPMQRLRRVRQLGTTYLVYPGATHSRLSHALGALRAAQDLVDAAIGNRESPRHTGDLLDEWGDEGSPTYEKNLAEATVLARLGALLHDFTHVPFGHTIEDDLKLLPPHDSNEARFKRLWAQFPQEARDAVAAGGLDAEVRALALSKCVPADWKSRYPFVEDIVGNTICADLLDYIRRDHMFTGLPLAVGDRFADDFYVVKSTDRHHAAHMAIRVTRGGKVRSDVITELLKFLRYRYELSERALYHHAKVAADAMIGKVLEMWRDAEWVDEAAANHSELVLSHRFDIDALHNEIEKTAPEDVERLDEFAAARLDDVLVTWSDDGLLETIAHRAEENVADKRWAAIGELTQSVLNRDTFKLIGWADGQDARAERDSLYESFGGPDKRRQLEREAALYAGLDHRYHVVLWIPNPDMKFKIAEVLVDDNGQVMPLSQFRGSGSDIIAAHQSLWGIGIYAHPSVRDGEKAGALVAFLSDRLGIKFIDHSGATAVEARELAITRLVQEHDLPPSREADLRSLVPAAKDLGTYADEEILVRATAVANDLLPATDTGQEE